MFMILLMHGTNMKIVHYHVRKNMQLSPTSNNIKTNSCDSSLLLSPVLSNCI